MEAREKKVREMEEAQVRQARLKQDLQRLLDEREDMVREREELERRKLQKMIWDGDGPPSAKKKKGEAGGGDEVDAAAAGGADMKPKVLRITRTFKNASGKEYTRTELVRIVIGRFTLFGDLNHDSL